MVVSATLKIPCQNLDWKKGTILKFWKSSIKIEQELSVFNESKSMFQKAFVLSNDENTSVK